MGYQVYEDRPARDRGVLRWAGYGVPAFCDIADCHTEIDRGMAYRCEDHGWFDAHDDWQEAEGCDLHFCAEHMARTDDHAAVTPKPDTFEWDAHLLTDASWQQWRDENPARVEGLVVALLPTATTPEKEAH